LITAANSNETGSLAQEKIDSTLVAPILEDIRLDLPLIHRGKVRHSFQYSNGRRVIVTTDRLSCFDRQICSIAHKGSVLNQLSRFWFEKTRDVVANHLIATPHPNVSIVLDCVVFPIEFIVRGYLTGSSVTSILTRYEAGEREYCGHVLPDGIGAHHKLEAAIVTPTTKAEDGEHDMLTSRQELIANGVISAADYDHIESLALALFQRGQDVALAQDLLLVDTKYEFGRDREGQIRVVDEVHTPDSSRYWYASRYEQDITEGRVPRALDKEFVRRYLKSVGYIGEGNPPEVPLHIRQEASKRYLETFQLMTGNSLDTRANSRTALASSASLTEDIQASIRSFVDH